MIWQVVHFLRPETICKFGGRIQPDEERRKGKKEKRPRFLVKETIGTGCASNK